MFHLAFMTSKYMNMILSGDKTIESRFYSTTRNHPAMTCREGHYIAFKRTGGNVEARAVASKVHFFEDLCPQSMIDIQRKFNDRIKADAKFWEQKANSVQGILIELTEVVPITIEKEHLPTSREGWIVLETEETIAQIPRKIPELLFSF